MAAKKRNTKPARFWKRKTDPDFKPDAKVSTWTKTSRMTLQQRLRLLKWVLYIAVIVLALVVQDVIMSQLIFWAAPRTCLWR